ncbi:MAG: hypothetical protein V7K71_15880 [Nostoc sp.]|uniref:hypothetical protein n=1 Tax=Nostoc sp. TaxID=1180 RepID=UPI002FFAE9DD
MLEEKAHNLLNQDLLSPLLAAGLFPDFIQRFLPFSINSWDRARGLEYAFEKGWDSTYKDGKKPNLLKGSYYDHWKADGSGSAPALVLNTTVVETGDRLVLSPFKINLPNLKDISMVACKAEDMDFPLSTAAVLSARFTLVTPVGWFNRCEKNEKGKSIESSSQKSRLADGGYFENSGVSTAVDIGSRLEEFLIKNPEKQSTINVVYLAITDRRSQEIQEAGGMNEILSPIKALWNSRDARGLSIIDQAEYLTDAASADAGLTPKNLFEKHYSFQRFRQLYLHNPKFKSQPEGKPLSSIIFESDLVQFPLGWLLSKPSQEAIKQRIGGKQNCKPDLSSTPNRSSTSTNNDCVFQSIKEELNNQPKVST